MATELSISIVATAAIGGAMRAFTQLGGGVQSLRSATRIATDEHRRLGGQIDRAMTRGSGNVGELIGKYYRLGVVSEVSIVWQICELVWMPILKMLGKFVAA